MRTGPQALVGRMGGHPPEPEGAPAPRTAGLAAFYAALREVEVVPGLNARHRRVALPDGGRLEIYRPSRSRPQPRQPGRLALCLQCRAEGEPATERLERWLGAVRGTVLSSRPRPRCLPRRPARRRASPRRSPGTVRSAG
ncbi:MAG: hypothetical protein VKI81_05195 [Synechococcaceae cyanobacterium]|nr:hypothetical protein [Synechococcaceae cyanobacterium]